MTCLSVLGVGKIGGEVAFLATVLGIADELILYDAYAPTLKAQVLDLKHSGLDIPISTDTRTVKGSDICVFSAGLPRNPTIKTRADLLEINLPAAQECSRALLGFGGVLITVTNPMDATNYYLCRKIGLEPSQCIGFGGQLDSARFALDLEAEGIPGHAWVMGDHGEHQVPLFSRLQKPVPEQKREEILAHLRHSSMEVIEGKGGTIFGPAWHIGQLLTTVMEDRKTLLTCSCVLEGEYGLEECSLGVPARIGRGGIQAIEEWKLDPWEQAKFDEAGAYIRGLCMRFNA